MHVLGLGSDCGPQWLTCATAVAMPQTFTFDNIVLKYFELQAIYHKFGSHWKTDKEINVIYITVHVLDLLFRVGSFTDSLIAR